MLAAYGVGLMVWGTLLLWAGFELGRALFDPALGGPTPASQSWRWHRALSPAFEAWAVDRIADREAANLSIANISGTEWPLFGAMFFLRATENLERDWQREPHGLQPSVYARGAIDAAADLLTDPVHATWVQQHWGEHYLNRENVFYRMLLIDGLAAHRYLTGDSRHGALLQQQVESLAAELSASPTGLLADYPAQTFPADVAGAWHAILRADAVLGSDHSTQATAGLRGFIGPMAPELDLPPYAWFGSNPPEATDVRGCANAWLLHHAPFIWPRQARQWFAAHSTHFWQQGSWLVGYREFAHGSGESFYQDVDSGPVLAGFGTSATAFGLGAARSFGAQREARGIALLAIAASIPLPNGRLLIPRLLSDSTDAPLLGEAALLYNLTQPAAPGFALVKGEMQWGHVPGIVWLALTLQALLGSAAVGIGAKRLIQAVRR